jgi:hypothetical protein
VRPALNAQGIALLQPIALDGDAVLVTTMLLHESGQWMRATHGMPLVARNPQAVCSAVTYGRRQGLLAIMGVAPAAEEDDDGEAGSSARGHARNGQGAKWEKPKALTLAQRADRLEATLRGVSTQTDLDKAYDLAAGLRAELDRSDPERLASVDDLYKLRSIALGGS